MEDDMPQQLIFGIVRSLHDLFTAVWIGGLVATGLAFMPAVKRSSEKPGSMKGLMKAYQSKLRSLALVSLAVLWITGILLSRQSSANAGLLNFSTTYNVFLSLKHLIILVMMGIAIYRGFILGRKIDGFDAKQQKLYAVLLLINVVLGVIVVFLSGFSAVLG